MRTISLCVLFTLFAIAVSAQSPSWTWAQKGGGGNSDVSYSSAADNYGNVFVGCNFRSDTAYFGSYTVLNSDTLAYDIGLVKYDSNGNVLWVRKAGGPGTDRIISVATDPSGNVLISGDFITSSITFGLVTVTASGTNHGFLVKYDTNGNVIWGKNTSGSKISIDGSGNIYTYTSFSGLSTVIGPDTLFNADNSGTTPDVVVIKYDSQGNILWANNAGGNGNEIPMAIGADAAGNVTLSGLFRSDTLAFASDILYLTTPGYSDLFVLQFNSAGSPQWAASGQSASSVLYCSDVATDAAGNVFIAGYYSANLIVFGNDSLINPGNNTYEIFYARYDAGGAIQWAQRAGGTGYDIPTSLAVNSLGQVYMTGTFGSMSITVGSFVLNNSSLWDNFFVAKFDQAGVITWCCSAGGMYDDVASSVSVGMNDEVYVSGNFSSDSILFDTSVLTKWPGGPAGSWHDVFVAKLAQGPTGLEDHAQAHFLDMYPNPSGGSFTVFTRDSTGIISITNNLGQEVYQNIISDHFQPIDLSSQPSGIYFVNVISGGETFTRKIVIQK